MNDLEKYTVTIPIPNYIPKGSGIHGTTGKDKAIRTRVSILERQTIEEAARLHGVTLSTFVRHCSVHAANELLKRDIEES